jgi:hypothetical protein
VPEVKLACQGFQHDGNMFKRVKVIEMVSSPVLLAGEIMVKLNVRLALEGLI